MKKVLHLLLVLTEVTAFGQMNIDLNQDTIIQCQAYDTLLGTQLTIMNAVEPIKYTWQSDILFSEEIYPASWALSDTTISTPTFTQQFPSAIMTFHLTVEDALGNTDSDSTVVVTSQHIGNQLFVTYYLAPGDSAQFTAPYFLTSNHPPNSYVWSPTEGLSDPFDPYPWASPDTITAYTVTLTDRWGCSSTYDPYIVIPLWLTSVPENDFTENNITLYPNPINHGGVLEITAESDEEIAISIFDMRGTMVQEGKFNRGSFALDPSLGKGAYACYLTFSTTSKHSPAIVRQIIIQ